MDTCVVDLRRVWKVPAAAAGGTAQLPDRRRARATNLASLISANDHPGVAVMEGQSGAVTMVLLINEQGRVADCSLVQSSGMAVLDAQSCAIMRERAKFTPAVGPDGKPRKDAMIQKVTWRLVG
jgi:TonB family protein